jgi:hypothetical protein
MSLNILKIWNVSDKVADLNEIHQFLYYGPFFRKPVSKIFVPSKVGVVLEQYETKTTFALQFFV